MSHINRISFVIVDDVPIVRYGLRDLLEQEAEMHIKAATGSVEEAIIAVNSNRPDIIILEKSIFTTKNIASLSRLTRQYGGKMLAYTIDQSRASAQAFIDQGGAAVVYKLDPLDELTNAIRALLAGRKYISHSLRQPSALTGREYGESVQNLSRRELEIARLVAEGHTSVEIADKLCISRRTVETHRFKIMRKLGISSRSELVALVRSNHTHL